MTLLIQHRNPVTDPLQARYLALKAERARIDTELRTLVVQMREGKCEVCGTPFSRVRATKRYCSQRCVIAASMANRRGFDLNEIRAYLPALKASGMMAPRALAVLDDILMADSNTFTVADRRGVSHQRVSQIATRAMNLIKFIKLVRAAADGPVEAVPDVPSL